MRITPNENVDKWGIMYGLQMRVWRLVCAWGPVCNIGFCGSGHKVRNQRPADIWLIQIKCSQVHKVLSRFIHFCSPKAKQCVDEAFKEIFTLRNACMAMKNTELTKNSQRTNYDPRQARDITSHQPLKTHILDRFPAVQRFEVWINDRLECR